MKKIVNLRDLLLAQLVDLYNSEVQEIKGLPVLRDRALSRELRDLIDKHIVETEVQLTRLDRVFQSVHRKVTSRENKTVQSLIDQSIELCDRCENPEVKDAALITAIQHINHYEIAGYGACCTYANALNANEVAAALHESLEEERRMNEQLSKIARSKVNARAVKTFGNKSVSKVSLMSVLGAY